MGSIVGSAIFLVVLIGVVYYIERKFITPPKIIPPKPPPLIGPTLKERHLAIVNAELSERTDKTAGVNIVVNVNTEDSETLDQVDSAQPVYFKPGEPDTFDAYGAQEHVLADLRDDLTTTLLNGDIALQSSYLFLGIAGMGKTLLAKIVANELSLARNHSVPFFEITPADIDNVKAMDARILQAHENPGCVMFFDETHDFGDSKHVRKLYLLLEEGRYQFHAAPFPQMLNPFTKLGATTDGGRLHPAFLRRWVHKHLFPYSYEQLLANLHKRPFPLDEDAGRYIVDRTHFGGAPWEPLRLYTLAVTAAKACGSTAITLEIAATIADRHGIDELGLNEMDRRIIQSLFQQPWFKIVKGERTLVGYKASEANVAAMAGADPSAYRHEIKPKLMGRGLLTVQGGQMLTPKAIELYAHLKG